MDVALCKPEGKRTCESLPQSVSIRMSKIIVNPAKDRRGNDTELQDLLDSLSEVGLLHPILVLPADDEGHHEVLAGHRRLRAARRLGWEEVPARIVTLDALRGELAALAENLVRKALAPGEELRAFARAKAIYEQLHPETKPGGARNQASGHDGHLKTDCFADFTARTSRQSARTIRRKAMIGERANSTILSALDEGTLSLGEAEHIVALPTEDQARELERSRRARGSVALQDPVAPSRSMLPSLSRKQALPRAARTLVLATQTILAEFGRVAFTMDEATLQLCRDCLLSAQASIAQILTLVEQRLRKIPSGEGIVHIEGSPV